MLFYTTKNRTESTLLAPSYAIVIHSTNARLPCAALQSIADVDTFDQSENNHPINQEDICHKSNHRKTAESIFEQ